MTDIPDAAHRARQMYADNRTIAEIKHETGLTGHAIYVWVDGGPEIEGKRPLDPLSRRTVRARKITAGDRVAMIGRIMRGCDQQISEIERRIDPTPGQMDQDSRRMAMISRTLNELTAMDERNREMTRRKAPRDNERARPVAKNDIPADVDELRRSLARQLDEIIAQGGAMLSGGSE